MKILIPILLVALVITPFTAFAQEQVDITGRFVGTWNTPNDEIPFKFGDVFKGQVMSQTGCEWELKDQTLKVLKKNELLLCTYGFDDEIEALIVFEKENGVFRAIGGYSVVDFGGNGASLSISKITEETNTLNIIVKVTGYVRGYYDDNNQYIEPSNDVFDTSMIIKNANERLQIFMTSSAVGNFS